MPENTTTIVRPPVSSLLSAVLVGGLFFLGGKYIESKPKPPQPKEPMTISVTADAKVMSAPDIAVVSFGVVTERMKTAKEATDSIKMRMTKVLDALKALGIEEKDITTENFWLNPVYDYTNGIQNMRGFQANESLSVRLRDLDKVGDALTAATAAGANQAGNVNFSIDNPDSLKAEAREKAIAKAKAKAETLAKSLGMSVGKLIGFSEGGDFVTPPMPMMAKSFDGYGGGAEAVMASVPVPAGEQAITVTVTLSFEVR